LAGILYLENNLTSGAFSPERVELLNLLISQMAISIENARLYTDLQQSERKYRTIFEDSRDMIFITTPTGEIIDASPACFDLLGYTREEFIQMNAQDTYARAIDRLRFREEVERHGSVKDLEIRLRRRDGVEIDCLMTATWWKAEDGTFLGYQGIDRNITAQKQAEQERLRLSAVERELSLAKDIQQSLLPPPKPGWPDLEVICYSMSAREVGGDLYAYYTSIPLFSRGNEWGTERKYMVAVGDVTSNGMPAALLMAFSLASLGSTVRQGLPPHQVLAQLDTVLVDYTRETRQNCALVYAEITPPEPT
jgi:PAS domain S-box-containing protein